MSFKPQIHSLSILNVVVTRKCWRETEFLIISDIYYSAHKELDCDFLPGIANNHTNPIIQTNPNSIVRQHTLAHYTLSTHPCALHIVNCQIIFNELMGQRPMHEWVNKYRAADGYGTLRILPVDHSLYCTVYYT